MSTVYSGANFLPNMDGFSGVKPFRFWCQTVLPLVYDDSLSYYELLNKVVFYINKIIDDTTTIEGEIVNLREAYEELENYVNEYFDSLDVSEEIDRKLDEMVLNGTFTTVVRPIISQQVSDWLETNITPTTPAIDESLTIEGAGADAKVTGDNFAQTLMNRGSLNSGDDVNVITAPGLYYIDAVNGYPANIPENTNGRILIIKTGSSSFANVCQLYFCAKNGHELLYYRVSRNQASGDVAWSGIKWYKIGNIDNIDGTFNVKRISIQLDYGTMTSSGSYATGVENRVRPQHCYKDIIKFKMTGYKIKFYYYNDVYDFTNSLGSKFVVSDEWQNIDTYVSPEPGYWFIPLIAKQGDGTISEADLATLRASLECYAEDDNAIIYQNKSVPYDATTYYASWDDLIAEYSGYAGMVISKTTLGYVNTTLPINLYELHPQRNWVDDSYARIQYDGTNELYPRKKILIIGCLHGNEKCTPMALRALAENILKGKLQDIAPKYDWYIIPLCNPWGYSHAGLDGNGDVLYLHPEDAVTVVDSSYAKNGGIRTNSLGYDINRDFSDNTFVYNDKTYGWQSAEAQVMKTFLTSMKWDVFIDCHQNHEDRSSNMKRLNEYIGIAWDGNSDPTYVAHVNNLYNLIDVACNNTNKILQEYYRHFPGRQVASVWQRESMSDTVGGTNYSGTACSYFGGFSRDGTGNTEHTSIAADSSFAIETSEVAWTYSALVEKWYNPIASTCCATAIAELLRAIAQFDE